MQRPVSCLHQQKGPLSHRGEGQGDKGQSIYSLSLTLSLRERGFIQRPVSCQRQQKGPLSLRERGRVIRVN